MFSLDRIEQDYLKNSFRLSEEEIIEIYQKEGATLSAFEKEIDDYIKIVNGGYDEKISAEERLLRSIFGEEKEEEEKRQKLIDKIPVPQKKHLSKSSQKVVIEGSLFIVFDSTRDWYNFFEGKAPIEELYYICLETLINCVKYIVHCEKPVFELYVIKSIERSMIKYISKKIHITYRETYKLLNGMRFRKPFPNIQFCEDKEEVEKPSEIFYRLKDEYFDIDYIKEVLLEEFLVDYNIALNNLNDLEKIVMQLSYDTDGYRGLTIREIADYLGIKDTKVSSIKKRAIKSLKKEKKLMGYNNL